MIRQDELKARIKNACASVVAAQDELTEIDSRFGDADHGITMTKIVSAIADAAEKSEGDIKTMLDDAAMAVMMINGGSAVPLWNTWLDGLMESAPAAKELSEEQLKAMFSGALEALSALSKAKVGDKTMMDALIPATEALVTAEGDGDAIFAAAAEAARIGVEASRSFVFPLWAAREATESRP